MNAINATPDEKTDWLQINALQNQLMSEIAYRVPVQDIQDTLSKMKSLIAKLEAEGEQDPNVNQPQFYNDMQTYQDDISKIEADLGQSGFKGYPQAMIDTENSSTVLQTLAHDIHI